MILLYTNKTLKDIPKVKLTDISLLTYAQTAKVLNMEVSYIKERIRNIYIIDKDIVVRLIANPPFPIHIKSDVVLWNDKFALKVDSINWEVLTIIVALSGSPNKVDTYNNMMDFTLKVKQNMMYLNVQLQEISARVNEFISGGNVYKRFDFIVVKQILRKRKIKFIEKNNRIIIDLPDVKIGNNTDGYIIYNNIYLFISEWNVLDGYILKFNNFSYSSFWKIQDVLLHPFLSAPYYINMPYLDASYESYIDNLIQIAKGKRYENSGIGLVSVNTIISDYNYYRRIWNGIRDPRLEDSMESYKKIFVKKD